MLRVPKLDLDTYEQIREMTRGFANEVIRPEAENLDEEERFPREIFKQMSELGLFGVTVPEELGSSGFPERSSRANRGRCLLSYLY